MKSIIYSRFILLVTALYLAACSSKDPDSVAERYWDAMLAGDTVELEKVVTEDSINTLGTVHAADAGSAFSLGDAHQIDANRIEIDTTVTLVQGASKTVNRINTVLIKEGEDWKVSLRETRRGLYASLLRNAFSDMGDSLQQGAAALQELGAQVAADMNQELSKTTQELQEKSKQWALEVNEDLIEATEELKLQTEQAGQALQQALDDIQEELEKN